MNLKEKIKYHESIKNPDMIDMLILLHDCYLAQLEEVEYLRHRRNEISKKTAELKNKGEIDNTKK